jgi:protein SCO1/2
MKVVLTALILLATVVRAEEGKPVTTYQTGLPSPLKNVGIDQKLNNQVPLELTFRDETGQTVQLSRYFGQRPVVLALVYYECPMLCNMVLNGMLRAFRTLSFNIGNEFDVVTVSFNPKEGPVLARAKQASYLDKYRRTGADKAWHFLTGDEPNIQKLAQAVGFRYTWDPVHNQFAHASGIMVLTPTGRIARYFYGIEYPPNDLRLGIIEASNGKIGSPVDAVLLYCFHYDASTGRYSLLISNIVKLLGSVSAIVLFGMIGLFLWHERRTKRVERPC